MPADWELPPGVDRALWDYLHDPELARLYDERLAGTPLLDIDRQFVLETCQPPGRLIDLGCGTGRLSLHLASRGYRVIAVDLSPSMLEVLGTKATALGLDIPRLCANLVELDGLADGSFDYAACLFSTLGLVIGHEARQRVVGHVARLLRPGGRFVLHVHNRWFHLGTAAGRRWLLRDVFLGSQAGDVEMPPHDGLGSLTMHLFTRGEVVRLLGSAGLKVLRVAPVNTGGYLPRPWWLPGWRAYGYLVLAEKRT